MFVRCAALALLSAISLMANEVALSRVGDLWKFVPGVGEPSTPSNAWQFSGFDESAWFCGRSGFSAGYLPNEATTLPTIPGDYGSVFFRRSFVLTSVAEIQWLIFRV